MDSRALLDHALFQLTPTRTRCDLVIFAGGVTEKLASGLLQPFLSHLKAAEDQISKGGYSISLRPFPSNAYWFTKATLQRFVRFVSTPEILERFVTIEKELEQIESSVQSSESADAEGASGSYQKSSANDVFKEDNSKVRLQRALETRQVVLRKEQAMAYARALVTGFELDCISDLISFADAFGASRLREACLNFMELCKKKNQDRVWMDEIAAMQASKLELPYLGTSGIVLAGEENYGSQINGISSGKLNGSVEASDSSHGSVELNQDGGLATPAHVQSMDSKAQVPMPWPNHHPQYMHNFQGPMYQQIPPYQGYLYPSMQFPPYFPGNMQWPPKAHDREPEDQKKHKSSSRNKKSSRGKELEASIQDDSTDPNDSSSETESYENLQNGAKESTEPIHKKKHGKKSSRKVVIRNINYITSKWDGEKGSMSNESSDGEEFIGEAIKQQVEQAVGSLGRQHKSTSHHHKKPHRSTIDDSNDEDKKVAFSNQEGRKGNDTWGAFQSILLQDKDLDSFESEPHPNLQLQEYSEMGMSSAVNLESEKITNQRAISNDSLLAAKRETNNEAEFHHGSFEAGENLRTLKTKMDSTYEEFLFSQRNEESKNCPQPTFSDHSTESLIIKSQKQGDWFISNQQYQSVNKDGRTFDGDYALSLAGDHFRSEESKKNLAVDDSFFIQNRSLVDDQSETIWRRDISIAADIVEAAQYENGNEKRANDKSEVYDAHEPDDLYMVVLGRDSAADNALSSWTREMDYENDPLSVEANETYVAEDKSFANVKPTNAKTGPGGKLADKEMKSKISKGNAGRSKTDLMSRTKKPTPGSKPTVPRSKNKEDETRRRLEELSIQRQKRIAEKSSAGNGAAASKRLPMKKIPTATSVKTEDPKLQSPSQVTKKTVFRSSTIERLAAARAAPKVDTVQSKAIKPKKPTSKTNGSSQKNNTSDQKKLSSSTVKADAPQKKEIKVATEQKPMQEPVPETSQPTNVIDEFKDIKELHSIASVEKNEVTELSRTEIKDDNISFHIDSSTPHENKVFIAAPVLHQDMKTEMSIHPMPESPNRETYISAENAREISVSSENLPQPKISEIQVSTPPPDEIIPEPVHSRKKWNSDETSPKAAKGFRKLLLFGRKSRTSTSVMA